MDLDELAHDIRGWALELGFQQVGIADTDLSRCAPDLRRWIAQGLHGTMGYMARNVDKRLHPDRLFDSTIRIISARMDYMSADALPALPANDGSAYVARYALGRDYHKTVRRRLARLAKRINARVADGRYRAFADSAPVLEKPLAAKAGIGWMGKNTLVLNENAGSMFFLGEIYTNIPLPLSAASAPDQCGACKACINVCPTGAILGPRRLDATKCISYLTIENKGSIPLHLREAVGNRVFGCDDCQTRLSLEPLCKNNGGSGLRAASRAGQREPCRSVELGRSDVLREDRGDGTQARQLSAMGSQPRRRGGQCALRREIDRAPVPPTAGRGRDGDGAHRLGARAPARAPSRGRHGGNGGMTARSRCEPCGFKGFERTVPDRT